MASPPQALASEPAQDPPKDPSQDPAPAPAAIAGQSLRCLALFLLLALGLLAFDLWTKHAAFKYVADTSIRLTRDDAGDPAVWTLTDRPPPMDVIHQGMAIVEKAENPAGKHWWVLSSRAHPEVPASAIPRHDPIEVIPGVLNLQLTINTGAVFGIGKGFRTGFLIIGVLAIGVIGYTFYRTSQKDYIFQIALAMILSGAIGNLYDRYFFAAVRDMLHMLPSTGLWPWIFNIADVALVVGVTVILIRSLAVDLFGKKTASTQANTQSESK